MALPNTDIQTADSKNTLSNGDLPWAVVVQPTTSAGQAGIGVNRHGLQPETWVIGFFADGDNAQQPIITGVLPGGPGAGSGNPSTSQVASIDPSQGTPGGGGDTGGSTGGTTATGDAAQREKQIWDQLRGLGYTPEQTAGIMGNLIHENPKYNPSLQVNDVGQTAGGLAMWRDRLPGLKAMYGNQWNTVASQVSYIDYELKRGNEKTAMRLLNNAAHDVDRAALAFAHFERFGKTRLSGGYNAQRFKQTGSGFAANDGNVKQRQASARAILAKYGGQPNTTAKAQNGPGNGGTGPIVINVNKNRTDLPPVSDNQ